MKGFTMLETLVAVLVLGLVVTASLKLTVLSQRGLAAARERESLMREAAIISINASLNPLDLFGSSGDVRWEVREKSSQSQTNDEINIEPLGFDSNAAMLIEKFKSRTNRWKEIEVTRKDKSITLFLTPRGDGVSSGDKM